MVFDATMSELNDYMWSSNFIFPSMGGLLMMVGLEIHMVNIDAG